MSKSTWMLVAVVVGGLAASCFIFAGDNSEDLDSAKAASPGAEIIFPENPASERSRWAPAAEREGGRAAAHLSLRDKFEKTSDLYSVYQEARSEAAAGSSEAHWFSYKVLDYCSQYAQNPSEYISNTEALVEGVSDDLARSLRYYRGSTAHRCRHFAASDIYSRGTAQERLVDAARAGSLAAEATLLVAGNPLSSNSDYPTSLVKNIVASNNPEAYLAISSAMGPGASAAGGALGPIAGSSDAVLAWQLAACRKGLDCSASGSLMTSYCANGGVCGTYADFRDLVFNGLVPLGEKRRIQGLVAKIMKMEDGQWN